MAPKKKATRMDLDEFLRGDGGVGSWADDDSAPSALAAGWGTGGSVFGESASLGTNVIAEREPVQLPTSPPYTARIFNLSYDATESSIRSFFVDQKLAVTSVRVPKDSETGKIKGYAFVEFEDVDSLKRAIDLEGTVFTGRPLRISVAEARNNDRYDDDWRGSRRGPLDPIERGSGRFGGGRGGFDEDLDWSTRRAPTAPESDRPRRGGFEQREGGRFDREGGREGGRFGGRGGFGEPEDNLDWSSRRDLGPARRDVGAPRRAPRAPAPEPDLDWSSRRELPPRAPREDRGPRPERAERPERSERPAERNFDNWTRGSRVPSGNSRSGAVGSEQAADRTSAEDAAKQPANKSISSLQRGFSVLNTEEDEDAGAEEEAPAPAAPRAAPAPLAETIAAVTENATEVGDKSSWTVSNSGKH